MVGTVAGGVVTNLASGELEYRNPDSGATAESNYTGSALVAEVYCTTCHAVTNANDPHKTGLPWTNGSFPLVVPAGANSLSFIEKSPTLNATTGTAVPGLIDGGSQGAGNTCVFCHKSRKDVTAYITASNRITSTFWGPHEGPQADVFSGLGGYAYANKTYGESTHQLKLQCVDCHMPNVANNANVPDHSFAPRLSACLGCHATATSFDVNGGQSLVRASMTELRTLLNNFGALTRSTTAPYLPIQPSDLSDPASVLSLDTPRPNGAADGGATIMTADQAGALYNYILVARGGAMGVHNTEVHAAARLRLDRRDGRDAGRRRDSAAVTRPGGPPGSFEPGWRAARAVLAALLFASCSEDRWRAPQPPVYAVEVAPILQRRCVALSQRRLAAGGVERDVVPRRHLLRLAVGSAGDAAGRRARAHPRRARCSSARRSARRERARCRRGLGRRCSSGLLGSGSHP